jgi:hypothetical protein
MVLTSASCRDEFFGPTAPKTVIVGSSKLGELTAGSERLNIVPDSAVPHPDWDPESLNANLLLFKIQRAKTNAPIELSLREAVEPTITSFGFGRVTLTGGVASEDLLRVDLLSSGPNCAEWVSMYNPARKGVSCGYAASFVSP